MFFNHSNNRKTHSILAHKQAPEWSRVKKKKSEPSELNLGYRRKKDGRACRLCFDAAHPGYQILLHDLIGQIDDSWQVSDDYWMNIFLIPWKIPTRTWMLLKPIHLATKKKHYNLTGLICTLLTCYRPMCYRMQWVDTWDQNKAFRLPHLFFSPRPCLAPVICRFFLHRST